MTKESLTYALIEQKIDQYVKDVVDDKRGSVERVAMSVALVALMLLWLLVQFAKSLIWVRLIEVSLGVVFLAIIVVVVCKARREWWAFKRRHDSVARELDRDYGQWRDLVAAMGCYQRVELARRLRYLRARRSSLVYKTALFSGSVQRLGVLPLLAVLYLQFKDWRFGDWRAFGQLHVVGGLLLWCLFLAYLVSWRLMGLGTRWDAYEALLVEATCDD